jgi:3',5'-cyclic AMP phosphodiesterase CpdA
MRRIVIVYLLAFLMVMAPVPAADLQLPLKPGSVRFAVIGDSGTGDPAQYEIARRMLSYRDNFPFDFVLMLGDNIYGGASPADYTAKFERPYKPLLDANVKFYASLGNHDNPNQRFYKPFNMGGQRYYSFKSGKAEFFALDSNYMDPQQLDWLTKQLQNSKANWKICFFHHPLYSDGRFHGPDRDLRDRLEPILRRFGVNVVLSGHEHIYERFKPRNGILYFVLGSSGQLRLHNLSPSAEMAKGFDNDLTFMLVEVTDDQFCFQTISRKNQTIDSGVTDLSGVKAAGASQ